MLSKAQIDYLKQTVAPHAAPMLSLYLDVNPANPDNSGKAYALRAREAMERLGVSQGLTRKVLEEIKH